MISGLGKLYSDGEAIVRQGEKGHCMYVIQKGKAEVVHERDGGEVRVATLRKGDSFGEMAIFEREERSATVRALGEARILTVDKRIFLRRVQEDPTVAFNILRMLCERIRRQNKELFELRRRIAREEED
jgi:CRP/FNR family cyclic AMP-dependent transcriptional regulator